MVTPFIQRSAMTTSLLLCLVVFTPALRLPWGRPKPTTRVAVLGGGFAGLTAARTLAKDKSVEVLLVDQRQYFEYTPGILRAWVKPKEHRALVNPIARLLRSKRARFERVPPGCTALLDYTSTTDAKRPLLFRIVREEESLVEYECDYAVLATGGELSPISDDRKAEDGSIVMRRRRLEGQVSAVMDNSNSALVVGGGLTGVELAAELAEKLGPGKVTLAVGPTLPARGQFPGDPGAGVLPGFRDTCDQKRNMGRGGAGRYAKKWLKKHGVRVMEEWAVPPPEGATLSNVTAAARPSCARSWRAAGTSATPAPDAWAQAGEAADIDGDAVFDCRGVRPNTREAFTGKAADGTAVFGLPSKVVM